MTRALDLSLAIIVIVSALWVLSQNAGWMMSAYESSPIDQYNILYLLFGASFSFYLGVFAAKERALMGIQAKLSALFLIAFFFAVSVISSIHMLSFVILLVQVFILITTQFKLSFVLKSLIPLMAFFLAIPGSSFIAMKLCSILGVSQDFYEVVKITAFFACVLLVAILMKVEEQDFLRSRVKLVAALSFSFFVIISDIFLTQKLQQQPALNIEFSDLKQDQWIGSSVAPSRFELELFSDGSVDKHVFVNKENTVITVLKYETSNHHSLHPPEICLTGDGYIINHQSVTSVTDDAQQVSYLRGSKADMKVEAVYWFSDDENSDPNIFQARFKRLFSGDSTMTLYLVYALDRRAQTLKPALTKFIETHIEKAGQAA